jgi:TonB family protein
MVRLSAVAFLLACFLTPSLHAQPAPPLPPGQPQCDGHDARIAPIMATHVTPPYPAISQRLGEQGTTILRVEIAPDGSVAGDSVDRSSGSQRLDQAALDFVKEHYRWQPMDCKTPVAVELRVLWALRQAPSTPLDLALVSQVIHFLNADPAGYPEGSAQLPRLVGTLVVIKDDGSVGQVAVIRGSGDPAIDRKSVETVRSHRWQPPQLDDKPLGAIIVVAVVWTPPGQPQPDAAELSRLMRYFAPPPPLPPPPLPPSRP